MRDICRSDRSARETLSSLSIDCPWKDPLFRASEPPMPVSDCLLFRNQMPITMGHLVAVRVLVSSPFPCLPCFLLGLLLLTYRKRYRSWQPTSIARLYRAGLALGPQAWADVAVVAVAVLVPGTCLSDLFSLCQFLKLLHPKRKQPNPFWFSFVVVLTAPA